MPWVVATPTPEHASLARFFVLIFVLSFFGWASLARMIRGEVLSLREREFVLAAKVIGVPTRKVLFKELLPNLVAPIVISASLSLPAYMSPKQAFPSSVSVWSSPPLLGPDHRRRHELLQSDPIYLWLPSSAITVLVLALSLLGDSVRDAFDPQHPTVLRRMPQRQKRRNRTMQWRRIIAVAATPPWPWASRLAAARRRQQRRQRRRRPEDRAQAKRDRPQRQGPGERDRGRQEGRHVTVLSDVTPNTFDPTDTYYVDANQIEKLLFRTPTQYQLAAKTPSRSWCRT